jgi:hypothetical protein
MYNKLVKYLAEKRLQTYLHNSNYNKEKAVELYEWNNKISKSLYTPLSYIEIILRNVCSKKFEKELGDQWYKNTKMLNGDNPEKGQWAKGKIEETERKILKHKAQKGINNYKITSDDIVSNLEFGFWTNLFVSNYGDTIWRPYLQFIFKNTQRKDLLKFLDSIKDLRNRIFHFESIIFDKELEQKHGKIIEMIRSMTDGDVHSHVQLVDDFSSLYEECKKTRALR